MGNFLSNILNNRNVVLGSVLIALLGIGIAFGAGQLFNNAILEADKDWEKALKFTEENAEEFPYSVKTKQGNLYVTGPVLAASPLVTHENINGEHMAIFERHERHQQHTQTYSCNCDDNGCSICTRTYWSWDYVDHKSWKVDKISLLGQEMSSDMIPWEHGYHHIDTKEGKYYQYESSSYRKAYDVIDDVSGSWGFTSNDDGFVYNSSLTGPKSGWLKALKIIVIVLILAGTGVGVYFFFTSTYEINDKYI